MAGSVNKVILIGNVGADPEIKRTQDGRPIANIRLATSESWRDKNSGERKEKTEWHRVVVFSEGLCKVVESYVKKGSKLYIEGQLQTRKWTRPVGRRSLFDRSRAAGFQLGADHARWRRRRRSRSAGMSEGGQAGYSPIDDYGADPAPRSSGGGRVAAAVAAVGGGGGGRSFEKELDDEVPF